MKIPHNKKWVLLEKEDYANYLFVTSVWEGFTYLPKKWGFENCEFLSAEYINSACNLFMTLDSYKKVGRSYFQTIFTKPDLWDKLHKDNKFYADKTAKFSEDVKKMNVKNLTNKKLYNLGQKFNQLQIENHDRRGFMFIIEVKDNILTNYLQNYLEEKARDHKIEKISTITAFQILTSPTQKSILKKEKEALIKIALIRDKEKQEKFLRRHAKKYEWLEYGLQGTMLDFEYFKKELTSIKRRSPRKLLKKIEKEIPELKKKQREVVKLYRVHPKHQRIFRIAREAIFLKGYSKDKQFYSYYCVENLLKEIGRRANLSLEQVRFLFIEDYKNILINKKDYSGITNERMKYSIHFSNNGRTVVYTGNKAKSVKAKLKFVETEELRGNKKEIKGQPAFQGKVKGKVKVINTPQEMIKMHQSDILVSHMTNPDIVPVMKKAGAIVTDLGGITCHAAIVARELKKPCVIGTKVATKILKDGDIVEVDAEKGIIKKIG